MLGVCLLFVGIVLINNGMCSLYNVDGKSAAMTIMTPIAPHTLNTRSIIFPAQDVITVEIGKGRHCDCEKGIASFDGDTFIPMVTGDCIQIRQADVKTKILKLNHLSFVEVLRRKMRDS